MAIKKKSQFWLNNHLSHRIHGRRFPLSGTIELSFRCNFRCRHCYLEGMRRCRELAPEQWRRILGQLSAAGVFGISMTGGEPLLRRDFSAIYLDAVRQGFLVTIFSNGSLVNEEVAGLLADNPPRSIEISLYGWDESSYRELTGSGLNFGRVMEGLDRLLARRIPVVLKTVLLRPLASGIEKMRRLARARGLDLFLDPSVDPTLRGDNSPLALRLEPRQAVRCELQDAKRLRRLLDYHRRWQNQADRKSGTACGAGFSSFNIDPAGRLSACLMLREPAISVIPGGFRRAWEILGRDGRPGYRAAGICHDCRYEHLCSYCPGLSHLGETPEPGSFYCRLAEARASALRRLASERAA